MKLWKYLLKRFNLNKSEVFRLIEEGRVILDGVVVFEPDMKIPQNPSIFVKDQYIIFHKPEGYVVSRNEKGKKLIYDILPERFRNFMPVGRLDKSAKGLLIMTTDKLAVHKLMHPKYKVPRGYLVKLDEEFDEGFVSDILKGFYDGKDYLKATKVVPLNKSNDFIGFADDDEYDRWVLLELMEGKFHEVKRIFKKFGYKVEILKRIYFGSIVLDVDEGKFRIISFEEFSSFSI